jgi:hypothetical protein
VTTRCAGRTSLEHSFCRFFQLRLGLIALNLDLGGGLEGLFLGRLEVLLELLDARQRAAAVGRPAIPLLPAQELELRLLAQLLGLG